MVTAMREPVTSSRKNRHWNQTHRTRSISSQTHHQNFLPKKKHRHHHHTTDYEEIPGRWVRHQLQFRRDQRRRQQGERWQPQQQEEQPPPCPSRYSKYQKPRRPQAQKEQQLGPLRCPRCRTRHRPTVQEER
ncbi:hypothetical protein DM02DRAFT_406755 [Periconia macrospinosa]|uniref:Uncharacterized protein n=1 Tax=Periconia macrospinosa TaxID=97972 RepID=A0A2V1E803_9PLEO|nr:hypothetical protein DM02DRAFT_406755 [Periconia macrospinosa]